MTDNGFNRLFGLVTTLLNTNVEAWDVDVARKIWSSAADEYSGMWEISGAIGGLTSRTASDRSTSALL